MAKKKVEPDEDDDDFDFDDFEEEDFEREFPKIEKEGEAKKEAPPPQKTDFELPPVEPEDELEFEDELEESEVIDYKYVKIHLEQHTGKNNYEITVKGQSHGFCNILVKYLLDVKGVIIAAYKIAAGINPPKIFIRLDDGYQLKDVIHEALNALRESVEEVQKVFYTII